MFTKRRLSFNIQSEPCYLVVFITRANNEALSPLKKDQTQPAQKRWSSI